MDECAPRRACVSLRLPPPSPALPPRLPLTFTWRSAAPRKTRGAPSEEPLLPQAPGAACGQRAPPHPGALSRSKAGTKCRDSGRGGGALQPGVSLWASASLPAGRHAPLPGAPGNEVLFCLRKQFFSCLGLSLGPGAQSPSCCRRPGPVAQGAVRVSGDSDSTS